MSFAVVHHACIVLERSVICASGECLHLRGSGQDLLETLMETIAEIYVVLETFWNRHLAMF
jgi:hypothetical protein